MLLRHLLLVSIGLLINVLANAQARVDYNWWDPAANSFPVIEGQAWTGEVQAPYDRLPARAEKTVSPDVWNLSHNSAGLYIKFKTNAEELIIRYVYYRDQRDRLVRDRLEWQLGLGAGPVYFWRHGGISLFPAESWRSWSGEGL
jgi:hypothetical protein